MIGWLRASLALGVVAAATPFLVLWLLIARAVGRGEGLAPRLWYRLAARALGLRVHAIGALAGQRPLLIAANHVSWIDIVVLGSMAEISFIAKSEMAGWPVIGALARWQRTIFVERDNRRRSGHQVDEIAGRLASGKALVLFPEGTTNDGNSVGAFKSTLFGAAAGAMSADGSAVQVQPVAIAYTRLQGLPMGRRHRPHAAWIGDQDLAPHVLALLRTGGIDVEVRFGEPFLSDGSSGRKQAAARAQAEVQSMMAASLASPLPSPRRS